MITVKCIYEKGDNVTTRINATFEEAQDYFLNRFFNVGLGPDDNMQKCIAIEEVKTPKGLLVSVLRSQDGDCTNKGISSNYKKFILIGEGIPEIFEPSDETPGLKLVKRHLFGREYFHCEPLNKPTGRGWMMGGNFIYTSDSRFREINEYPIPVHDRQEFQGVNY